MSQPAVNKMDTGNGNVRKFGLRDKFGYLFGDFGNDFFFTFVTLS